MFHNGETTMKTESPVTVSQLHCGLGALLGLAVGDALGAPFEFGPAGKWSKRFPQAVPGGIGEMVGGSGWSPGEFTDDTQMALALAESLIANSGLDLDDVWVRFRAWSTTAKDVGNITSAALSHESRHGAADAAHKLLGQSAGNGSLMRVLPLSLVLLDEDTEAVMRAAFEQSGLTHADPAAGWGAAIYTELVRRTIRGDNPFAELDQIIAEVPEPYRAGFNEVLHPQWHPDLGGPGNGSVWGCLAQAVWAVRSTSSFEHALTTAIDLGGDTDTVAAVAGGLAGARYGIQCIPSRWISYVNGTMTTPNGTLEYNNAALQDTARRLLGLQPASSTAPEASSAGPTQVAEHLYAADLEGGATVPTNWAVLSLCRPKALFANHPLRREAYIIDKDGQNTNLLAVLHDTVDTIDAWLREGHNIVVHCHGGRSRTGLVLKAWAMRAKGLSERRAHEWLAPQWDRYEDYSRDFAYILRNEWTEHCSHKPQAFGVLPRA
jgi:ADP-ribosyl-[dinitrogen reductase] hydrolase